MNTTAFAETSFFLFIAFAIVIPFSIYGLLLSKRTIARTTVLLSGLALVAIAGVDVFLVQKLQSLAKSSSSLADDLLFASRLSFALYLLPALFGGIGINIISHELVRHLSGTESQPDR